MTPQYSSAPPKATKPAAATAMKSAGFRGLPGRHHVSAGAARWTEPEAATARLYSHQMSRALSLPHIVTVCPNEVSQSLVNAYRVHHSHTPSLPHSHTSIT